LAPASGVYLVRFYQNRRADRADPEGSLAEESSAIPLTRPMLRQNRTARQPASASGGECRTTWFDIFPACVFPPCAGGDVGETRFDGAGERLPVLGGLETSAFDTICDRAHEGVDAMRWIPLRDGRRSRPESRSLSPDVGRPDLPVVSWVPSLTAGSAPWRRPTSIGETTCVSTGDRSTIERYLGPRMRFADNIDYPQQARAFSRSD
jgi:hypothetical protein